MIFSDSSESACCSVSIGESLRDCASTVPILHSDLMREVSHLVFADRNCLPGAQPRRELELVAHPFGRIVDQQVALVVVAHLEDFRCCLLAFHIPLAQLLIDNDLHLTSLLFSSPHEFGPVNRSYKRIVLATRSAGSRSWRIPRDAVADLLVEISAHKETNDRRTARINLSCQHDSQIAQIEISAVVCATENTSLDDNP